jgi:hypothetical protein
MWYDAVEAKDLQRLHDQLSKSVGKLCDVLNNDDLQVPDWVDGVVADLRVINDMLWKRRLGKLEPAVLKHRGHEE